MKAGRAVLRAEGARQAQKRDIGASLSRVVRLNSTTQK
jgi:hypothetical protein